MDYQERDLMKNGVLTCMCAILALAGVAGSLVAQEKVDPTVETRLLEILKKRGVIDDKEYDDLMDLAEEIRQQEDLEGRLETQVDDLVARLSDEQPKTGYRIGRGFNWTSADGNFKLTIGGRLQVRFTYHAVDNDPDTNDEDEPDFDVARARVWLRGHAFGKDLKYKFQFDIAGDEADTSVGSSSNRLTELKDAYIEWAKYKAFIVRAGQFKVPYSRQQLTSSGAQQFVDRSGVDRDFARGRNPGLMVFGKAGGEKQDMFEYYAGAFDGEGENKDNNDEGLLWVGRVAVNPLGAVKYSQSDIEGTEDFIFAVGFNAFLHQDDNHVNAGDDWAMGGDIAAFWKGFFATFELHYLERENPGGADLDALGWFGQIGYFVVPEVFEIAFRATEVDFDNSTGRTARREFLVAAGYFMHGHNLKIQADFGWVEDHFATTSDNVDELRLRFQFQIIF
jgi:hypothetical protein